MTREQLFPRNKRRLRQPTKDAMREQLAIAADEIMRLREENDRLRLPLWRRIVRRAA